MYIISFNLEADAQWVCFHEEDPGNWIDADPNLTVLCNRLETEHGITSVVTSIDLESFHREAGYYVSTYGMAAFVDYVREGSL
jgi:hypothetical protein